VRLDVHHDRSGVGEQQVIGDMFPFLASDDSRQQERLSDDALHQPIEVGQ
jgi:hypothetical protein